MFLYHPYVLFSQYMTIPRIYINKVHLCLVRLCATSSGTPKFMPETLSVSIVSIKQKNSHVWIGCAIRVSIDVSPDWQGGQYIAHESLSESARATSCPPYN